MSDFLFSEDESTQPPSPSNKEPWHILIVDDEPSVHDVTRLTLGRLEVFDQPLEMHSALSAKEARELLSTSDINFSMAFVDVVMETQEAGLELVEWIRNELGNSEIRLILRTGQAGMAPESDVIRNYDINDYRAKTDLTAQSLSTCVFNAIRGYRDITTISKSLSAFRKLIDTSAILLKEDNLHHLASSAFKGLLHILNMEKSQLYILRRLTQFDSLEETLFSCHGQNAEAKNIALTDLPQEIRDKIEKAYSEQTTMIDDHDFVGYFSTGRDSGSVLYVEFKDDPAHLHSNIVEIFASQAVLIFENLSRQIQIEDSQKELLYLVGDAIEARSLETGSHVKRVAIFCEYFAKELKQKPEFVNAIKIAAPLHDIGKIAIPEAILHKPGKLDADEWAIMQTHAAAGGTLLEKSNLPVAKLGARLARWHHENWDGSGYPDGLKGEDIPIEARIMAIADVFDALGAKRSYKEPWPKEKILEFIMEQRGIKFDPTLVDILNDKFDELIELRNQYPD